MYDKLRVISCPLCRIFTDKEVTSRLYWPETLDNIENEEFVIIYNKDTKTPQIIYGEHVTTLTREGWGRVLYRCRKIFGGNVTLKVAKITCRDHIHYNIYNIK